jgi:predicted transcriptional regulator
MIAVQNRALTNDAARLLREWRAAGANQQDLAEAFGISQGLVSMIVTGRKYLDAGGPINRPSRPYRRKSSHGAR